MQNSPCRLPLAIAALLVAAACGERSSPTSPTATASTESATLSALKPAVVVSVTPVDLPGESGPSAVSFPPRNEPLLFRTALEAKYRDGLRRSSSATYVDQEGTVVWTQEYLRYRVNLCSHAEATSRVMTQIAGQGIPATCGSPVTATFPPRNEPLDFMIQLEARYRDGLRRPASASHVDVEGNIIWTQEYLRYRVSGCGHLDAQQKVFNQIDGQPLPADCTPCRYCPTPTEQIVFCDATRTYSFEVRPVEPDIQWTLEVTNFNWGGVQITSPMSGTGRGTVTYRAPRPAYGCEAVSVISVGGLSNLYPRETHTVRWQ